jgi:hypothetical protein
MGRLEGEGKCRNSTSHVCFGNEIFGMLGKYLRHDEYADKRWSGRIATTGRQPV